MAESQETPNVEQGLAQQPTPDPSLSQQSQESPKMSLQEFEKALSEGKIDVSSTSTPEEAFAKYVDWDKDGTKSAADEGGEQPQTQGEDKPTTTEQEPQPSASAEPRSPQKEEVPRFKTIGELLRYAKDETGDEFQNAYEFIKSSKNRKEHLSRLQSAVEQWKRDATTHKSAADSVRAEMAKIKAEHDKLAELLKEAQARPARQQQTPPTQQDTVEIDEPEIAPPDDLDDQVSWNSYWQRVRERDARISDKKLKAEREALRQEIESVKQGWQSELEKERSRLRQENEARLKRESQQRRFEETVIAATDFQKRNREFAFDDGKDIRAKNDEYNGWVETLNHIASQNPAYANRDLAGEFLAGNQDVVALADKYGVQPPSDANKFRLLVELEQIARQHGHLVSPQYDSQGRLIEGSGRPDFEAAYAIKKMRDGVDLDEIRQARVKGADEVLSVMQDRQSAPPELSAHEATVVAGQKATQGQIDDAMTNLQRNMSTMTPEQAQKELAKVEEMFRSAGIALAPQSQ